MKTSDFDYELPEELIAQTPLEKRSESRLLVVNKNDKNLKHDYFTNIINYLNKDDVLVLNDTKVLPARIYGIKDKTGAHIELLLLNQYGNHLWEALVKPAKRVKKGTIVSFGDDQLKVECVEVLDEGIRHFKLIYDGELEKILDTLGEMPLPPYIHEKLENQDRYQTVYSKNLGSAAAPTAGLHFTKALLNKIKSKGVRIAYLTLHVGLGTFRPVKVEDVKAHKMHSEFYQLSTSTAQLLSKSKDEGHRIVAVGTTSVRTLETIYKKFDGFKADSGFTDIFIYPGYKYKAVDTLITNFHLPKSTLLMLVSAFSSKEIIMNAYQVAIEEKYRFFSFGDSMIIQ
ncbi:MAG TPA: tRNA preQ1(34) S-adenosylmethionine ribosyltransferase-isomerase QueA [Candidatus Izemoplasmatales bacterium]|nr:tRNA preQ1(34) S-adenosylmethionine ribosyltransferase-isomerase QueA [Candidatus Izemoplasmatales bacterium]